MACTIARERESGTLYQLMITALRRREIVIGKMFPYLVVSSLLIVIIMLLSGWHFGVAFHDLPALAAGLPSLSSLFAWARVADLGFLAPRKPRRSSFRFFFLLPVFVLSGALRHSNNYPRRFATSPSFFHLHIFCRAFRAGEHVWRGSAILC